VNSTDGSLIAIDTGGTATEGYFVERRHADGRLLFRRACCSERF
jgi:hypothetical protein